MCQYDDSRMTLEAPEDRVNMEVNMEDTWVSESLFGAELPGQYPQQGHPHGTLYDKRYIFIVLDHWEFGSFVTADILTNQQVLNNTC